MASTEKTEKITEERKRARKESDMIRQIRAKIDLTDAKAVLKMYNKLIEDKIFETLVGYTFENFKKVKQFINSLSAFTDKFRQISHSTTTKYSNIALFINTIPFRVHILTLVSKYS